MPISRGVETQLDDFWLGGRRSFWSRMIQITEPAMAPWGSHLNSTSRLAHAAAELKDRLAWLFLGHLSVQPKERTDATK